jgi:hypothetical protein
VRALIHRKPGIGRIVSATRLGDRKYLLDEQRDSAWRRTTRERRAKISREGL